ncbi:S-layer homology domain-containing protein [uncultured Flavonifractor sp.]|uniref:S-layer homology domain-containing protein n=1 Tax=uncultured Flavonifractor sp. TaxID=1193534 RepID=UPI00266F1855|nr:S-layer homology domain-containing protein [uncultured Flavonifractor sp.]
MLVKETAAITQFDCIRIGDPHQDGKFSRIGFDCITVKLEPSLSGTLAISGTARGGEILTADLTAVRPQEAHDQLTYQWYRDNSPIPGATDEYYQVTHEDVGYTIQLRAVWQGEGGERGALLSAPTGPVEEEIVTRRYYVELDVTGGSAVLSNRRPSAGSLVTITLAPAAGNTLDSIQVVTTQGTAVTLNQVGQNKYTFRQPRVDVTVRVVFKEAEGILGLPFTDVKAGDWFYEAVKYVYDNKLMDGTSSTTFAPFMTTNRAMVVTILWRLEGQPETDASLSFTDVESGVWYTDAVNWAASKGIVKGYSDTVFAPNDTVTREQLATILYRYAEYKEYDVSDKGDLTTFADGANTSSWAAEAMEWAIGSGLLTGKDSGKLDPAGTATRAEIATILMRFAESEK